MAFAGRVVAKEVSPVGGAIKKRKKRAIFTVPDSRLGRRVAVKRNVDLEQAREEFLAMMSYGRNPYLVKAHRYFVRRGMGYIVMEWIPGASLRQVVAAHGPLPPGKVIAIAGNILSGLEILHRAGYIHADLHCGNVMVTDFHRSAIKIIDLQHAVPIGAGGTACAKRRLARPPVTLAPESTLGVIDVRYDLYGVGYMCAAMLLGREPERLADGLKKVDSHAPGAFLWPVIRKATAPDPGKRYGSAREMAAALRSGGGSQRLPRIKWGLAPYFSGLSLT